jgi:hypothetical protein
MENTELLRAALFGLEHREREIQSQISEVKALLNGRLATSPVLEKKPRKKKKHTISPEGRARIAEAQRRRWATKKKASRQKA